MTSHLTPTPRVDKTGRTVIRHMRSEVPENRAKSPIPAPSVQEAIERSEALLAGPSIAEDRDKLASLLGGDGNADDMLKLWRRVARVLPEDAVLRALETLETYPRSEGVGKAVRAALRTWRTGNQDGVITQVAFAAVEHHFDYRGSSPRVARQLSNIGTHALPYVLDQSWDDQPSPEQLSQAVAVAHTVAALIVHDEQKDDSPESYASAPAWAIINENDGLLKEVMAYHTRALEIAEFVKERGGDPEFLREFLNQEKTPLIGGFL